MKAFSTLVGLALLSACPALADSTLPAAPLANTALPNPQQEQRARDLMATIRCVVCQGQSIADSNAELAGDMRSMIRYRIAVGETPDSIRAWLVRRYGQWVTYDPSLNSLTAPLWLLPLLMLALGGGLVVGRLRWRRR